MQNVRHQHIVPMITQEFTVAKLPIHSAQRANQCGGCCFYTTQTFQRHQQLVNPTLQPFIKVAWLALFIILPLRDFNYYQLASAEAGIYVTLLHMQQLSFLITARLCTCQSSCSCCLLTHRCVYHSGSAQQFVVGRTKWDSYSPTFNKAKFMNCAFR